MTQGSEPEVSRIHDRKTVLRRPVIRAA